jgi:hypothetical protein
MLTLPDDLMPLTVNANKKPTCIFGFDDLTRHLMKVVPETR